MKVSFNRKCAPNSPISALNEKQKQKETNKKKKDKEWRNLNLSRLWSVIIYRLRERGDWGGISRHRQSQKGWEGGGGGNWILNVNDRSLTLVFFRISFISSFVYHIFSLDRYASPLYCSRYISNDTEKENLGKFKGCWVGDHFLHSRVVGTQGLTAKLVRLPANCQLHIHLFRLVEIFN